jgi:hypothetical protein
VKHALCLNQIGQLKTRGSPVAGRAGVAGTRAICLLMVALAAWAPSLQGAARPTVRSDSSVYGFPDFLSTLSPASKGWMFAPPFVGLKWVELNGVLLLGNSGTNDAATGLTFTTEVKPYVVSGFDWEKASQRPARNGLCRGGIHGNRNAMGLTLRATAGRTYLLEVLALGTAAQKRTMNVVVDGSTVVTNWTVLADQAANRWLRLDLVAAADHINLELTPGSVAGTDTNPAVTALALSDITDGAWSHDPVFGRQPAGMVNIASQGTASSPDNLEQDGDGRGDLAAIDGDPNTYWDEQDGAKLYRLSVTFQQPEPVAALAVMGWAQQDFAPKDFEVFCDGRPVAKVENAPYTNNVFMLPIRETSGQTFELRITGYYGRSPAIRELGIYRQATPRKVVSDGDLPLSIEESPAGTEWTVNHRGQKVLVYSSVPAKFKPYVKELCTVTGFNILRDAPHDHLHHHALMYGIKVNGVNFWEETPGCGFQRAVGRPRLRVGRDAQALPQAVLSQTLHWVPGPSPTGAGDVPPALLVEQRTLTLAVSQTEREVALHWNSVFEVGPATNQVTLTGANYHGLGMRFLQELDARAQHLNAGGAPDLNGRQDVSRHPWGAVLFGAGGPAATVVLFGHPDNIRGDAWFFTMRSPFAYLSATQNLDQEPLVYRRGDQFQLNYLITLYPEVKSPEAINARGQAWMKTK